MLGWCQYFWIQLCSCLMLFSSSGCALGCSMDTECPMRIAGQVEVQLAGVQPLIDAARTAVGGIKADHINEVWTRLLDVCKCMCGASRTAAGHRHCLLRCRWRSPATARLGTAGLLAYACISNAALWGPAQAVLTALRQMTGLAGSGWEGGDCIARGSSSTASPVQQNAPIKYVCCDAVQVRSLRMPSDVIRDVLEGVLLLMGQVGVVPGFWIQKPHRGATQRLTWGQAPAIVTCHA